MWLRKLDRLLNGRDIARASLLGFCLLLLRGVANAADPIVLTCAGSAWDFRTLPLSQRINGTLSLKMYMDAKMVVGSWNQYDSTTDPHLIGEYAITEEAQDRVVFKKPYLEGQQVTAFITGVANRISGMTDITVQRSGEEKLIFAYKLQCEPAKKLF